jgi:hypothetical protein
MQMQMHDAENIASKTLAAIKALLISCINIAAPIKNMQVKTKNLVPWFDKDFFQKNVIDFITRPFPPK